MQLAMGIQKNQSNPEMPRLAPIMLLKLPIMLWSNAPYSSYYVQIHPLRKFFVGYIPYIVHVICGLLTVIIIIIG